ncbi:HPr kinase/phosphorylase [Mesorhizobium sp. CAU 1741]|uniref:HPr kinase/phosphorylase n=1 Tax=Mesorhizobium sp. CAU 1741 TaxID=3140366 RepID=UPI00325A5459
MVQPVNLHATALVVGTAGLLVTGRSGAGKSTLALAILDHHRNRHVFAALVADDRVWVDVRHGRLVASVPHSIAGLVEVWGFGPSPVAHEGRAVIDGVVALVDAEAAPRYRGDEMETILGVDLPRLDIAERGTIAATQAITSWVRSTLGCR